MRHSPSRHARHWTWLAFLPALAVCGSSPADSSGPTSPTPVISTVGVSPSSVALNIGQSVVLAATVDDQNGNAMSGQTVAWTSSNTAIATVNANGSVVGVALGTATITATASGKSATATVTVVTGTPGPPATVLLSEPFEDGNFTSRGWYDSPNPPVTTAEHTGTGSTASVVYHWTVGATKPAGGFGMRRKFPASGTIYVAYDVKYSANWIGSGKPYHPHEFLIASTLEGDYDGPADSYLEVYLEQNYQNGGIPKIGIQDSKSINTSMGSLPRNLIGVTENRSVTGCNGVSEPSVVQECYAAAGSATGWLNDKTFTGPVVFSPTPGAPGYKNNWNHVEAYFQLNSIANGVGQTDGVMQYWFNGQLVIDRHDVVFRTGARPTVMFNKFLISPFIGDGSPVDQSMWIDNLVVATARPQ